LGYRKKIFLLLLNDRDVFEEKINNIKIPLTKCFREYDGPNDYKNTTNYISDHFRVKVRETYVENRIKQHFACIDDDIGKMIFNFVKCFQIYRNLVGLS